MKLPLAVTDYIKICHTASLSFFCTEITNIKFGFFLILEKLWLPISGISMAHL